MVRSGDLLDEGRDMLRLSSRSGDLVVLLLSSLTSILDIGTPLVIVDIFCLFPCLVLSAS